MPLDGGLVAAGGRAGEGGRHAIGRDVLGVAKKQPDERGLGVRAVKSAARKLACRHVVQPHDQVGRHDGSGVVAGLLRGIDACHVVAAACEHRLEGVAGHIVSLEREPRARKLLPAIEPAAHGIQRVARGHVGAGGSACVERA